MMFGVLLSLGFGGLFRVVGYWFLCFWCVVSVAGCVVCCWLIYCWFFLFVCGRCWVLLCEVNG